ncbi:MAG: hypothetical protein AAF411_12380, partial [Myxococcota bacterium]
MNRFAALLVVVATAGLVTGNPVEAQTSCSTSTLDGVVNVAGEVLNAYVAGPEPTTLLTVDAGENAIPVDATTLRGTGTFAEGDLVMILQVQGARIDGREEGVLNGVYGDGDDDPASPDRQGVVDDADFTAGTYELNVAAGPIAGNALPLEAPLANSYRARGAVTDSGNTGIGYQRYQVIRVASFRDLTIDAGASLVAAPWDGRTGGVVAVDVAGTLTVNGVVDASGRGFRGGAPTISTEVDSNQRGVQGEGIAGTPNRVFSRVGGRVDTTNTYFGAVNERGGPGNAGGTPVRRDSGGGGAGDRAPGR